MEQVSRYTKKSWHYRNTTRIAYLVSFFILFAVFNAYGKESGCVRCHTDEKMLKPLVVVPKISEEAGGG
jgi:hypothetical protein